MTLREIIGYPVEGVVGPAFVGYTDGAAFRPAHAEGLRFLGPQDVTMLARLQGTCSTLEWEHGGSQLSDQPVVGIFVEEHLVVVAGYELWGDVIAHIAVITHPQYRGQGYGRSVVCRLTEEVLFRGLVPQYRTLEANGASMTIARMLGFERYATTVAVRFRPDGSQPSAPADS